MGRITYIHAALCISILFLCLTGCPDIDLRTTIYGRTFACTPLSSENGGTVAERTPLLDWSDAGAAGGYQVQYAESEEQLADAAVIDTTISEYEMPGPVTINDVFFWRVRILDEDGEPGDWSETSTFSIAPSSSPEEIYSYDTGGHSFGPAIKGNYLLAAAGDAGLQVIDFTDPAEPVLKTTFFSEAGAEPYNITINGNYAYMVEYNVENSFKILDISDPTSPSVEGASTYGGNFIVSTGQRTILMSGSDLIFMDTLDPSSPNYLDTYDVTTDNPSAGYTWKSVRDGVYLYTAVSNGLVICDMFQPPYFLSTYIYSANIGYAGVDKKGDYAYLSAESAGLLIIDVRDPEQPTLAATFEYTGGIYADVIISGNYLFTNFTDGLLILDITDPVAPEVIAASDAPLAWGTVTGNYCICGNYPLGTLVIVDLLPAE